MAATTFLTRIALLGSLVAILVLSHDPLVAQESTIANASQGRFRRAAPEDRVPGQYIVLLEDTFLPEDVPLLAEELTSARGGQVRVLLQHAVRGFTASLSEVEAIRLSQDPRVRFVEENSRVHLSSEQVLPTDNSLWALDRIDQPTSILGGDDRYRYCERASGVIVYVLDTGINKDHKELTGRVL